MATVTINVAFGENGLIEKAKLAKKMAENSTAAEQEGMNSLLGEYENIMGTPGEGGGSGTDSTIEELQNTIKDLNNQIEELKKKEAIGDATESDVVSGKTFSSSLGTGLIGAMPTYASGSTAITTAGRWGFDTTYGPWAYIPNDGYYKKAHWINIPWNTVKGNLGDAAASNVLSGKTFTSSNGVKIGGSMPNRGQLNWSGSNTTYSVPAGYYSGGTIDTRPSYNAGYSAGYNNTYPNMVVRDNKSVGYSFSSVQNISFSVPANKLAICTVFNDYYITGNVPVKASLSSGSIKYYDASSVQLSGTGGHGYILRTYVIKTSSSSATLTLSSMGAITGTLLY